MIAGLGHGRYRGRGASVNHPLRGSAGQTSPRTGGKNHGVGVVEIGRNRHIGRDAGYGQRIIRSGVITSPAGKVMAISRIRHGCHHCAIITVLHNLRNFPGQTSPSPGNKGHGIGIDGEIGGNGHIGGYVRDSHRVY